MGSKTFLAVRFWGGLALSWMNDSSVGPGSVELGQNLTSRERQGRAQKLLESVEDLPGCCGM